VDCGLAAPASFPPLFKPEFECTHGRRRRISPGWAGFRDSGANAWLLIKRLVRNLSTRGVFVSWDHAGGVGAYTTYVTPTPGLLFPFRHRHQFFQPSMLPIDEISRSLARFITSGWSWPLRIARFVDRPFACVHLLIGEGEFLYCRPQLTFSLH